MQARALQSGPRAQPWSARVSRAPACRPGTDASPRCVTGQHSAALGRPVVQDRYSRGMGARQPLEHAAGTPCPHGPPAASTTGVAPRTGRGAACACRLRLGMRPAPRPQPELVRVPGDRGVPRRSSPSEGGSPAVGPALPAFTGSASASALVSLRTVTATASDVTGQWIEGRVPGFRIGAGGRAPACRQAGPREPGVAIRPGPDADGRSRLQRTVALQAGAIPNRMTDRVPDTTARAPRATGRLPYVQSWS
jgi:hypothetical protein